MVTKQELIDFEQWTVDTFNDGKLRSPVHLSGGNEDQLIEIFKEIKPQDWVFTTYRSHYHALLKGVPEERLKNWILDNKSIHFMDAEYKVFSSAIVGGCLPIALGVAMALKKDCDELENSIKRMDWKDIKVKDVKVSSMKRVWCFVGDMTASLGVFNDCLTYANHYNLPITFVIENNRLSTDTNTAQVWGEKDSDFEEWYDMLEYKYPERVKHYTYERVWPHYGTGKFIAAIWKDIIKDDDARNKGF